MPLAATICLILPLFVIARDHLLELKLMTYRCKILCFLYDHQPWVSLELLTAVTLDFAAVDDVAASRKIPPACDMSQQAMHCAALALLSIYIRAQRKTHSLYRSIKCMHANANAHTPSRHSHTHMRARTHEWTNTPSLWIWMYIDSKSEIAKNSKSEIAKNEMRKDSKAITQFTPFKR